MVVTRNRLHFGRVLRFVWTAILIAVPEAAVHGQSSLPEFALPSPPKGVHPPTISQLTVRHWVPPLHPSLVGKSAAETALQSATGSTLPLWTGTDSGYTFQMVGLDPTVAHSNPISTIKAQLIPVKFNFWGSSIVVFDPAKKDSCAPSSPLALVQNSPIFINTSLPQVSASLGTAQFVSLFQRANFFKYTGPTGINPNYEVTFTLSTLPEVTVTVYSDPISFMGCDPLAAIEWSTFDYLVQRVILKFVEPWSKAHDITHFPSQQCGHV